MPNNLSMIPLFVVSIFLNTLAQSLLKLGSGGNLVNIYLLGGLLSYGISTFFYILVLGKLNLSMAYPVIIGLTIIATTFSGAYFFKEQVSSIHWIGIGLILSGVCAISLGKTL